MTEEKQQPEQSNETKKEKTKAKEQGRVGRFAWTAFCIALSLFLLTGYFQSEMEKEIERRRQAEIAKEQERLRIAREAQEWAKQQWKKKLEYWSQFYNRAYELPPRQSHFLPHSFAARGKTCISWLMEKGTYQIQLHINTRNDRVELYKLSDKNQTFHIKEDWQEVRIADFYRGYIQPHSFWVNVTNKDNEPRVVKINGSCPDSTYKLKPVSN